MIVDLLKYIICFFLGPFVSALANAYGFRTVCILGAVISSVAFGISSFATSIYFLQFTFGVMGGKTSFLTFQHVDILHSLYIWFIHPLQKS